MKKLILTIELVPASSWFDNVRSAIPKTQWDHLRKQVYSQAYHVCQICGGEGPRHPVECHEIWDYNDRTGVQKLEGMVALCPNCHLVKHIGLAGLRGEGKKAFDHFTKVNKLRQKQAKQEIATAFKLWEKRSQQKWTVDISYLKSYGIDTDAIGSPGNEFGRKK